MSTIYQQWNDGELGDIEALRALCSDLREVESERAGIDQEREALRNQIERIVGKLGNKADVPGFGTLVITEPSVTASYDTKTLDRLIIQLTQDGFAPIAEQISQCRREGMRVGSLRINREKAYKEANARRSEL